MSLATSDRVLVTYSASSLPPKEVFHGHGGTQHFRVKFPTFLGRSRGFVRLHDTSWKTPRDQQLGRLRSRLDSNANSNMSIQKPLTQPSYQRTPSVSLSRKGSYRRANSEIYSDVAYPLNFHPRNHSRSISFPKQLSSDYSEMSKECSYADIPDSTSNTKMIKENTSLPNFFERCQRAPPTGIKKNDSYRHGNMERYADVAYPLTFHPRNHSRSVSFTRHAMSENSELSRAGSFADIGSNCNNCDSPTYESEWIELFFEFPDGFRQRFQMRYNAVFKHAIRAFTARMGFKSINDLVFVTSSNQHIFINDSPKTINMKPRETITVSNMCQH